MCDVDEPWLSRRREIESVRNGVIQQQRREKATDVQWSAEHQFQSSELND